MSLIPSSVVSHASSLARTPVASEVAHVMREDAQRAEYKLTAGQAQYTGGSVKQDDPVRYDALGRDEDGRIVSNGKVAGHAVDSDEAQLIVKNINTKTDLKISRWSEIAGYTRWAALALMGSAFGMIAAKVGAGALAAEATTGFMATLSTGGAAIGGVMVSAPFVLLMTAAVIVAGVSLSMTQNVRKLQSERWMDVQGFMQERAAVKVGKQVSVAVAPQRTDGKQWQETVRMSQADVQLDEGRGV